MRARLILISIIIAIIVSLLTYGNLHIFQENRINFLSKEIIVNSEIVISLIVLLTLLVVFLIGLTDKLLFKRQTKKMNKRKEEK